MNYIREVDCIVEAGVKYCEKEDLNLREVGLASLGLIVWVSIILICLTKGIDDYDSATGKLWALLALIVSISPFIAMIIFG